MKGRVLRESEGLSAAMGLKRLCALKTGLSWGFFFFFFSVLAVLGLHCGGQASLPHGMWELSSPTRDQTYVLCIGRQIFNNWTTREILS